MIPTIRAPAGETPFWTNMWKAVVCLCVVFITSPAEAGNICPIKNMDSPAYYTPETENNAVVIDIDIVSKKVDNGVESFEPRKDAVNHGFSYGALNPPANISVHQAEIKDSAKNSHLITMGFNGTHVCVAFNHATLKADGARSAWSEVCVQKCRPAFQADTGLDQMEYYVDETNADKKRYDYISVAVTKDTSTQGTVVCFASNGIAPVATCALGKRCVITATTTNVTAPSPYAFQASCEPQAICSSPTEEECKDNVTSSHVGPGMYARVCNYCCHFNKCNDIGRCDQVNGTCSIYGPPPTRPVITTSPGNETDGTSNSVTISPVLNINILVALAGFLILSVRY